MFSDLQNDLWPIHILLVEDEPLIRAPVAEDLRDRGFTVIEASNSDEALAYFEASSSLDLVVTDTQMPGAMNGLEFARLVAEREPLMPIIIASGHVRPDPAEDFRVLPKPYSTTELIELITKTLGVKRRAETDRQTGRSSYRR
jgi:CheY-like chemotaxis protein